MNEVKITIESAHTGITHPDGRPEIKYDFEVHGEKSEVFSTICEFFGKMPKEHFKLWRQAVNYTLIHDLGLCPFCQTGDCKTYVNENDNNSGESTL